MTESHPDFDSQDEQRLENDEVWELLQNSPSPQASPLFSRNIMRDIRLDESSSQSFWARFSWPRLIFPAALTVLIAIGFLSLNSPQPLNSPSLATQTQAAESTQLVEARFEEELLAAAADYPELFSDDELVALLF